MEILTSYFRFLFLAFLFFILLLLTTYKRRRTRRKVAIIIKTDDCDDDIDYFHVSMTIPMIRTPIPMYRDNQDNQDKNKFAEIIN